MHGTVSHAKVKYALYNSRSIQAESDDDHASDQSTPSRSVHRRPRCVPETRVQLTYPKISEIKKNHSSESNPEILVSLHQVYTFNPSIIAFYFTYNVHMIL